MLSRNKHRNKLNRRRTVLYMVILLECELKKKNINHLHLIFRKVHRLIGRIQGSGLTRGSKYNENNQTTSAYKEYANTIRRVMQSL